MTPQFARTPLFHQFLAVAFLVLALASPCHSQAKQAGERPFAPLNSMEIGGGVIGERTSVLPTNNASVPQTTTNALGGVISVKDRPFSWAGFELNYGLSEFSEKFSATPSFRVKTAMHEGTGAVIFHPRLFQLRPFVAIGGGYLVFAPTQGRSQWRATGLGEIGLDIPTPDPHVGFRVQGRVLVYSAPNFYNTGLGTANWVATTEPMVGAWYRW